MEFSPIFITNQPPVPFQQGQSAYAGQHVPPGYPGQPFPQGQTAVPSNNLPNATMWYKEIFICNYSWIMLYFLEEAIKMRPVEMIKWCMLWRWLMSRYFSIYNTFWLNTFSENLTHLSISHDALSQSRYLCNVWLTDWQTRQTKQSG